MPEISITEGAVVALEELVQRTGETEPGLRIYVDHQCHCGGLKYGMELGNAHDDDVELEVTGITVRVASAVARQPGTAVIDFVRSPLQTGFTLTNSEHACGGMTHGR